MKFLLKKKKEKKRSNLKWYLKDILWIFLICDTLMEAKVLFQEVRVGFVADNGTLWQVFL